MILLLDQLHVKLLVGSKRLQSLLLGALLSLALDQFIELLHSFDAQNPVYILDQVRWRAPFSRGRIKDVSAHARAS